MTPASHPTEDQFARFRRRALASSELLEISDHLAVCDACRERLFHEEQAGPQLRALRIELSAHLEYEEIAAVAEGVVGAGVATHIEGCAPCRAEVEELRRFRSELKRAPVEMP